MKETPYNDKTCIIVVSVDESLVGLIVDSISDVVTISDENMSKYQQSGNAAATTYLTSVSKVDNRAIIHLDCSKFISSDL